MNFYQDIRLLPDAESNLGYIWQKVFQQVHIALVKSKIGNNQSEVGISIPKYKQPESGVKTFPLGDTLRLFAMKEQSLQDLVLHNVLIRFEDYAQVKSTKPVPAHSQFVSFTRKHVKGENRLLKKARQMAKFKAKETGDSEEKWFNHYSKESAKLLTSLPYIQISRSVTEQNKGKNDFKLFIDMHLLDKPNIGSFSCYGLSPKRDKMSTVPWF